MLGSRFLLEDNLYSLQMKRLHLIIFTITLLLSQWGSIDHVYHDHIAGEVCDFCITAKSFDNAVTSSFQATTLTKQTQQVDILLQASISQSVTRYYSVRAPPRLI